MTIQTRPGRFRYTVILASTERGVQRYDSLDAMPAVLRARCLKALESRESGTVVIAGQAESGADTPPASTQAASHGSAPAPRACPQESRLALWLRLAVAAAAAAAAIVLHWRP